MERYERRNFAPETGNGNGSGTGPENGRHLSNRLFIYHANDDTFPRYTRVEGFEGLPENLRRIYVYRFVDAVREYYAGYIVQDPFGTDEQARLDWQTEKLKKSIEETRQPEDDLTARFAEFQDRNKLRIAKISGVLGLCNSLGAMLDKYKIHTPQAERVREIISRLPPIPLNVAKPDMTTAVGQRLEAAMGHVAENPKDAMLQREYEEKSWKIMEFSKKVEYVKQLDAVLAEFLHVMTTDTDSQNP